MFKHNVTRGYGLLENFLAKQRLKITNKLIENSYRTGNILDIGCGSYPYFLKNTSFNCKFGLDKINSNYYKESEFTDINFVNYNFEINKKLPLESSFFDVVTMLAVFEHIEPPNITILLNEIYRLLKKDGIFIMTTPAIWTDKLLRVMAKLYLVSPNEIQEHKDAYNFSKITSFFDKSNFNTKNLKLGYFEMFLNIWASIKK